ncbi:MAG: ATP-binding protein, partial [Patulibacter sp.]|nr:ATP-binding protein [Patulibacter sp.]
RPLDDVLDPVAVGRLREQIASGVSAVGWQRVALIGTQHEAKLHAFRPRPDLVAFDLVPVSLNEPAGDARAIERVAGWSSRLLASDTVETLLAFVVGVVRSRTGFDGAWVCRIQPDANSVVVAADADAAGDIVGQSVLATDVPPDQPHVLERPVPFFVADLTADGEQLTPAPDAFDADGSTLLRPYPVFLDRLRSIGVRSTLSIPVVVHGELWGRILAHHPLASRIGSATQAELGLLGIATGARLTELIDLEDVRERVDLARCTVRAVQAIASSAELLDGLAGDPESLCGLCVADAAVVALGSRELSVGCDLGGSARAQVIAVARATLVGGADPVVASRTVDGGAMPEQFVGFLAARLSENGNDVIVWLRRERRHEVTWVDHEIVGTADQADLFSGVGERVEDERGLSEPWTAAQLQQADEFRQALGGVIVARYDAMQTSNVELRRSNVEYDAFASAAAHDLKAPLRGIRQFTEFFLMDVGDRITEEERDQLDTVTRLAARMNALLDDLMDYAKVGNVELQPQPVDLARAVGEVVELLGAAGAEQATISVDEDVSIIADPSALRQLLFNLLGNALKYSSTPAVITVARTTIGEIGDLAAPPPSLAGASPDTEILTVRDRGVGIDPEFHERIFQLFRQLDADVAGTGAGLALCRLIARRHGGDVWLTSAPGNGTTFFVALHVHQDDR